MSIPFGLLLPGAAASGVPGATWRANQDTNVTVDCTAGNQQLRLRAGVINGGGVGSDTGFKWRFSKNAGAYTDLTASSSNVKTFASAHYADGDDVPQILTAGDYLTDNNSAEESTGAFTLGAGLGASERFESETTLELIAADLANNDTLDFRITLADNTVLTTYTVTPRVTIQKGAGDPVRRLGLMGVG